MSQTFKKKTLVVALSAVLAAGAVVPTVASANVFADTAIINSNSSSINVQAKASQQPGNTITVTEVTTGAISAGTTNPVLLSLDNGARFTGATVTTAAGGAFTFTPTVVALTAPTLVQNTYHPLFTFNYNGTFYAVKIRDTAGTSLSTSTTVYYTSGADAASAIAATNYSTGTAVGTAGTLQYLTVALVTELNNISGSLVAANHSTAASATGVVFAPAATSSIGGAATAVGAYKVVSGVAIASTSAANSLGSNVTVTAGNAPTINASGQITMSLTAVATGSVGSIALSGTVIDASASTVGSPINLTVTGTGTGANGANNTTRVANVTAGALTAALTGTAISGTNSAIVTLPAFTVTERFAGDAAVAVVGADATTSKVLQFKLSSNAKFATFSISTAATSQVLGNKVVTYTATTASTTAATLLVMKRDGSVVQVSVPVFGAGANAGSAALSTALQASGFVLNTDFTVAGDAVTFTAGRGGFASAITGGASNPGTPSSATAYGISDAGVVSVPVSTASTGTGAITVGGTAALTSTDTGSLTVTASAGSIAASALTVGTISQATAGAGTTALVFNDVAPVGLATVYTGRASNTVFNTSDTLRLSESVKAQIPSGSLLSITLNSGNFATVPTVVAIGAAPTFGTVTSNGGQALVSSTGVSTAATTADFVNIAGFTVDLSAVTKTGDLTVALGGNPSVTSTTAVKVATIADATSTSVSGTLPTAAAGTAGVALPDVVITESAAGALVAGASNYVVVAAPTAQIASFDISAASVKALKADGTDVTSTIFGTATVAPVACTGATGTACFQILPVANSTSATGPVTFKISGVKATLGSSASGDLKVNVGGSGATSGVDITSTSTTATTAIGSDIGAKATKVVGLKVGSALASTPTIAATVSGAVTSQTITSSLAPASGDLNAPGQVFVLAQLGNSMFSLTAAGTWVPVTFSSTIASGGSTVYKTGLDASSVYRVGSLSVIPSIPVVQSLDLSSIVGAVVYVGYGKNSFDTDAAFNNMISNSTYRIVATVTK